MKVKIKILTLTMVFLGITNLFSQTHSQYFNKFLVVVANATISGHVYADTNGNGTQDLSEPDLADVNMVILQSNASVQAVITDINGDWSAVVPEGLTNVYLDNNDLPSGYLLTEGTDPTSVVAIANQNNYAGTDGIHYRGILSGHLYFDDNGNGTQNASEPNMANVDVKLTDGFGNIHNLTTDVNGNWSKSLAVSQVQVLIITTDPDFPNGATQTEGTNPSSHNVILSTTTFTENDGFFKSALLSGHLYFDNNNNGVQNGAESDMANVEIFITTSFGTVISVTTDSLGNWSSRVPVGNTLITINTSDPDFPNGATQTQGSNPQSVVVINAQNIATTPCGFYSSGTLTGHLYYDVNNNGIQNVGELNIPNITVNVTDASGQNYAIETDANGNWSVVVSAGNAVATINTNDSDFLQNIVQTQGTNPTTTLVISNQSVVSDIDGFYSAYDADGDGISNLIEISNGSDPLAPCDPIQQAGYTGYVATNTIWQAADCDGDGITNGTEHTNGTDPYNPCSPIPPSHYTGYNPSNPIWQTADCDGDGLTNLQEVNINTNPFDSDTDGDGISDGVENTNQTNPLAPCDPIQQAGYTGYVATNTIWQAADCDGDGITNGTEHNNGTDPYNPCEPMQSAGYTGYNPSNPIWQVADCDNDGIPNGPEVTQLTDPYDPNEGGLVIYNAITPDSDGLNDIFYIKNIEYFPQNNVKIFNRWGVLVFDIDAYDNVNRVFSGYSEGRVTLSGKDKLPTGTYFYRLTYTNAEGQQKSKDGYLYLN